MIITIPVVFGISIITYAMVNFAPGDPITAMISPDALSAFSPEWVEQRREALGLNKPLPVRYLIWLGEASQGNLGYSYLDSEPVTEKVGERIWPTVKLMLTVLTISVVIGIPLGVLSAVRQYSVLDYLVGILGFAAVSIPSFFLALSLVFVFSLWLEWLPTAGMNTIGAAPSLRDSTLHLILPALALGLAQAAPIIRYTRSTMLETIRQDYVTVARSKGLRERVVIFRHALRNVLIPLVTIIALDLPALLGGTVIIEQVFAWPGMGTLAITSVFGRDYPVIMGITLLGSLMILASNLIADVVYALVDPRIRYS